MWTNWAGTVSADVTAVRPGTVRELVRTVADAAEHGRAIKPIGAGHSFTAIAETGGVQLRLDRLSGIVRADRATGLVTVLAGTPLHALNDALWQLGLALTNLGDIDVQTISGAISTGTHGTGAKLGGIATQVRALEIITGDGERRRCSADENPELFAAARVGLGALGVLATVTLQCEPAYALAAAEAPGTLDETLATLDEQLVGNDHFEFYWFPHTRRVLTKRNNRVLPGTPLRPLGRARHWLDDEFLSNTVFDRVNRVTTRRPQLIPRANALATRLLGARDYIDRSYRVFASPRTVRFREMEYAVPRAAVPQVLAEIERWFARSGTQVGFPIEVRFAAADDIWLSTATGRDSGYIAVHQYVRREYEPYFRAVEAIAADVDGRPHWGKIHYRDAASLRGTYSRLDEFAALRDKLDPQRIFTNAYLERVLGG
ncbi:D-arabinono-1,4-lactone oxidase [uncultured Jatrophihabitans sp.]|uniref:D-arabinono-1,4-lactone oxidase n=1 Tax=uncultured Jatrophihabitans sp. TaxID=1610747 RepID=UPI0035CC69CB